MGYFKASVGRPPGTRPETKPAPAAAHPPATGAFFGAGLGRPVAVVGAAATGADCRCPRCRGELIPDAGLFRCTGRCGRRWLAAGAGRWLDPAALPLGACSCCDPRVPLVAAECGAICPQSHTEYLVLPEGIRPRHIAAPLGICRCCLPPQPLMAVEGELVCRAKPHQHYTAAGEPMVWKGKDLLPDQAAVTAAIDAALNANTAQLGVYGLFVPPN